MLGLERSEIRNDGDDIAAAELAHRLFHQLIVRAVARAGLNVNQLPRHLAWRAARNRGHVAQALQVGTVADGAANRFAIAAGSDEVLPFLQAALRGISHEAGSRVAKFSAI